MESQSTQKLITPPPKPPNPISELWWFFAAATCVKLLLIPAYRSTDFEVHRHWLAITHSLPLSQWYLDETSPWTLDYPPFFAYFERFLSIFANLIDPQIVHLHNGLNYASDTVVYFQRVSVCVSDLCLFYGVYRLTRNLDPLRRKLIWVLVVWSPMLVVVDHLHFQYNGTCWIKQVIHRMFPFGRGLCHAYWAPNFWVFYIVLDKVIVFLLGKLGFNIQAPAASFTGGLVGDSSPFAVLPQITPAITFIIVLLALSPCLIKAWRDPRPVMITRWVAYAYTCGFLFGWHVHEKASLHFVIPLAIVAVQNLDTARHYFFLPIVSCYSLFPLLFESQEYPIKVLLLLLHSLLMWLGFSAHCTKDRTLEMAPPAKNKESHQGINRSVAAAQKGGFDIGWVVWSYLIGLLLVEIWGQFLHPIFLGAKLPFAPLMLISVYCSLGVMYSFLWQLKHFLVS